MRLGLFNFLLGRKTVLYPLESIIINAIRSSLNPEASSLLQKQVDSVNRVQRLVEGKEVDFYCSSRGEPAFDDHLRFPCMRDEALLATVRLADLDSKATLKVEAWIVRGWLFSLMFAKSPKRFFAGRPLDSIEPEVVSVKIWMDPMIMDADENKPFADWSFFIGWVREWHDSGRLKDARAPLSIAARSTAIERIDARLPTDYLEFVEQTDGGVMGGYTLHGLSGIRKVSLEEHDGYILAEDYERDGFLVVKEGSSTGEIYRIQHDDDEGIALGCSFRRAIEELCGI